MSLLWQYFGEMIVWILVVFGVELIIWKCKKESTFNRYLLIRMAFIAYLVGVCSQTIFPNIVYGTLNGTEKFFVKIYYIHGDVHTVNLLPFNTILSQFAGENEAVNYTDRSVVSILNLLGNSCLYLPIGFMLPFIKPKYSSMSKVLILVACLSITIEVLQYFIGRSADIDDVILHVFGAAIGYIIEEFIHIKLTSRKRISA